jgi:hypothetical protein
VLPVLTAVAAVVVWPAMVAPVVPASQALRVPMRWQPVRPVVPAPTAATAVQAVPVEPAD